MQPHLERALFVVGEANSGKSKQLRSMFLDVRFGNDGIIPSGRKLQEIYRLSNDRCLYLRLTSPHEAGEFIGKRPSREKKLKNFFEKTTETIATYHHHAIRRWNFASALQRSRSNHMPDAVTTCGAFVERFKPERTRVVFLNPDRHGVHLSEEIYLRLVDRLREIPRLDICCIDARNREANGLFLADFFDFT
jgi:hypothetical protein